MVDSNLEAEAWQPLIGPYSCFGRSWMMRTTDPALAAFLEDAYSALRSPSPSAPPTDTTVLSAVPPTPGALGGVYEGEELVRQATTHGELLGHLVWATIRTVAAASADRLLLHAAALELDGTAIALVGPSNSGKSTLAAGLMGQRFGYLSDEVVGVSSDLTVEGFAKPVSLGPGVWRDLGHLEPTGPPELLRYFTRQWQLPAHRIGTVSERGRLRALLLLSHSGHGATLVRPVDAGTALKRAMPCAFSPHRDRLPAARVRDLAQMLGDVPCVEIVTGRLGDACAAIAEIASAPASWSIHRGQGG